MPVHVGAALSNLDLKIQRDDTGDNISKKNPQYCELTAQYWLWKNTKSDYCGLCHYRRFLGFKDDGTKRNARLQIEASVINDYNIKRFGLDDDQLMRETIESYDIITGEPQDVRRLPTPKGKQKTVYQHWTAHERYLIMQDDLEKMLAILEDVSPELGAATRKYLRGHYFLGFNCFVMKRELFDKLCAIEFEVLERLEKEIDLSNYSQQVSRIYGFMGEIISSAFIDYVEKKKSGKVKHVPLVYFNFTDPQTPIKPVSKKKSNTVPIMFYAADTDPILFGVSWQAFLDSVKADSSSFYDANILLASPNQAFVSELRNMLDASKASQRVSLRIRDIKYEREYRSERFKLEDARTSLLGDGKCYFSILPFIPYLYPEYKKAVVVDCCTLPVKPLSEFWQAYKDTKQIIAAPYDILTIAQANDTQSRAARDQLASFLDDPLEYFSAKLFLLDFDRFRRAFSEADIATVYTTPNNDLQLRSAASVLNCLCAGHAEIADQKWATMLESNDYLKIQMPFAPLAKYQALKSAQKDPGAIIYLDDDPFMPEYNDLQRVFWKLARQTPFYEYYLQHCIFVNDLIKRINKRTLSTKLAPINSKLRDKLLQAFPYGSKRYAALKKVMTKAKIR